jgi:hypothetical protein
MTAPFGSGSGGALAEDGLPDVGNGDALLVVDERAEDVAAVDGEQLAC